MIRKNIPNFITAFRILGTFCLLFIEPLTPAFYIIYLLSGISDVVDGWLARKMNLTSEFGSKLDSIADLMYYAVMVIKIFPILLKKLPLTFWCSLSVVIAIRIAAYIVAWVKYRRFASLHTYLNKITGAGVFLVPFVINLAFFVVFSMIVCFISGLASVEELMIHIRMKEYTSDKKEIYSKS